MTWCPRADSSPARPPRFVDRDKLFEHLRGVASQGFALDLEECERGVSCAAAPVVDGMGRLVAALSVSGPVTRLDEPELLRRIQAGEDFGKIAQEVSTGPEAAKGGDLGVFTRGVMPEAFDRVVFSLPEGKTSKVVKSPYGFHVFKVLQRDRGHWIEFADVKEKIKLEGRSWSKDRPSCSGTTRTTRQRRK